MGKKLMSGSKYQTDPANPLTWLNGNRQHQRLLDVSVALIVLLDTTGRIRMINPKGCEVLGGAEEEILGLDWFENFIFPEQRDEIRNVFRTLMDGETDAVRFYENPIRRLDGKSRLLLWHNMVLRDPEGLSAGLLASATDLTAERHLESEAGRMDRRFRTLFELSTDGILLLDETDRILDANPSFLRMTSLERDEILGAELSDLGRTPNRRGGLTAEIALEEASLTPSAMFSIQDANGRTLDFEVSRTVLSKDPGEKLLTFRDISARLQHTRERERLLAELSRSNRDLEQFAYIASHDLRSPLHSISNFVELLAEKLAGRVDKKERKYLHFIETGLQRMQEMIEGLLAFSRAGRKSGRQESVKVGDVFEEVMEDLALELRQTGADVVCEELPTIRTHREQLRKVFQNLLENALKYAGDSPPVVRVGAEKEGLEWVFFVEDRGMGVPTLRRDAVFEPFQRAVKRSEIRGTGMGLTICKKLVERRGGRIEMDSTIGEGTTVRFTFPEMTQT